MSEIVDIELGEFSCISKKECVLDGFYIDSAFVDFRVILSRREFYEVINPRTKIISIKAVVERETAEEKQARQLEEKKLKVSKLQDEIKKLEEEIK